MPKTRGFNPNTPQNENGDSAYDHMVTESLKNLHIPTGHAKLNWELCGVVDDLPATIAILERIIHVYSS